MGTALGSRDRLAVDGLMEPGQPAARGSGNVSLRSLPPGCAPLAVCWGRPDAGARSRPHLCHAPAVHRSAARRWQALPLAADRRCRCCRCLEPLQACAATTDRVEGTVQLQAAPQGRPQAREIQRGSCCAAKRGGRRRWPCISVAAEAGCAPGCKSPLALRETFLSLARPGAPALAAEPQVPVQRRRQQRSGQQCRNQVSCQQRNQAGTLPHCAMGEQRPTRWPFCSSHFPHRSICGTRGRCQRRSGRRAGGGALRRRRHSSRRHCRRSCRRAAGRGLRQQQRGREQRQALVYV